MYIILISYDGNGAGDAYGPFESRPDAQTVSDKLIQKWTDSSEYDTIDEYINATACYGPWIDVLEVADVDAAMKWPQSMSPIQY